MIIKVLHNQSLIDIATQYTGKAENYLQIAMENNLVPTDPITPGTTLTIPDDIEKDEDIVRYYTANGIQLATELTETQTEALELTFWQKVIKAFTK